MPRGRKTKFNDQLKDAMLALYEKGRTDNQVAKAIGVTPKTLRNWRGKHPSFKAMVKDCKNMADELVVASLFQRAVGYTVPEEKLFCYEGFVVRAKTRKHYPPDIQAAQFWLKNRQPKKWRDKTEQDVNVNSMDKLTPEQLDAKIKALLAKTDE